MIKHFRGTEGLAVVLTFILLGLAAPAYAQSPSLGDMARKEQERRKESTTPQKVYTNQDLKDAGLPSGAPPADASPAGATSSGDAAKPSTEAQNPPAKSAASETAADKGTKGEAEWHLRIT